MMENHAVFLYDGDCAFCSRFARWVRSLPVRAQVQAWQFSDLDALGVQQRDAEEAVQWIGSDGSHVAGPLAISRLLRTAGPLWMPVSVVLGAQPIRRLAWLVYRWFARNRHRLPGGTAACSLSQAQRDILSE